MNVFPTQIEARILTDERLSPHYVLEVARDGAMDTLTIKMEIRQDLVDAPANVRDECGARLAHEIKAYVGVSARIEITEPHAVERSLGKARRLNDLRRP